MSDPFPSRIYLTGFMGAGKTTLGRELAALMNRTFIDSDEMIGQLAGKPVPMIFEQDGEAAFRLLEKKALEQIASGDKKYVIALGGGATCNQSNLDLVLSSGFVVYIQLPAPVLTSRLKGETAKRPLLSDLPPGGLNDYIEHKLEERKPFYEQAHLMVNGLHLAAPLLYEILRASFPQVHK